MAHFRQTTDGTRASTKRGSGARGFRGVGRLAGLGYCQELIFRSRGIGDSFVAELHWDCKKLRALLQRDAEINSVADLIAAVVTVARVSADNHPPHFFEVELRGVVRTRNDKLLSPHAMADDLAQSHPCHSRRISNSAPTFRQHFSHFVSLGNVGLHVSGIEGQIYRPHRNTLELGKDGIDEFQSLEILEIPSIDGAPAAIGWILTTAIAAQFQTRRS